MTRRDSTRCATSTRGSRPSVIFNQLKINYKEMQLHSVTATTLFICTLLGISESQYTSVVQTANGPVRGKILKTARRNVTYASFQGIPYAKSPEGELRFQPPVEMENWSEVLDAYDAGSECLQYIFHASTFVGSVNCLFLNVYTPHTDFTKINKNNLKPVMVWIHGGGFIVGSGTYKTGPDFFLEEDVILVPINYRLGPLGFLNLNHKNATGNMGLKDQNLALKWVKKNIAKFGGDPNRVTVSGQSTGAASVDFHVLSEMSAGLFSRSLAISGSSLALFWGAQTRSEGLSLAKSLVSKLGSKAETDEEILKVLKTASAEDITAKAANAEYASFRPTIERVSDINNEKFLSECAVDKYRSGNYHKTPHMLGFTSFETKLTEMIDNVLPLISRIKGVVKNASITLNEPILEKVSHNPNATLQPADYIKLSRVLSDLVVGTGIDSKQKLLTRHNKHPIYYYRFSYDSNLPAEIYNRNPPFHIDGAEHSDDLLYLFYVSPLQIQNKDPGVDLTINRYARLVTNFAKYGNPTPDGRKDDLLKVKWPTSGKLGLHLEINKELTVGPRPVSEGVLHYEALGIGTSRCINGCL